jgi:hypothetical protein
VTTDAQPSPRKLDTGAIDPLTKITPVVIPEVRLMFPIGDAVQIGGALGLVVASTDFRPSVRQSPSASAADKNGEGTYQGHGIGFLPKGTTESATGTLVLPVLSLEARVAF